MQKQYLNTLVLSCTQATLQTTGVTMIAITGLAGFALNDNKALATLPLTPSAATPAGVVTQLCHFEGDRHQVRQASVQHALQRLAELLVT